MAASPCRLADQPVDNDTMRHIAAKVVEVEITPLADIDP
jgi:hypothetical protein